MKPVIADNPLRDRADLQRFARDLTAPLLPHFSAGRAQVRLGPNRAHYGDPAGWLEAHAALAATPAPVAEFILYESHLGRDGPHYDPVAEFALG